MYLFGVFLRIAGQGHAGIQEKIEKLNRSLRKSVGTAFEVLKGRHCPRTCYPTFSREMGSSFSVLRL